VSSLSWKRGFWSLIATQFQGAFSDNAYKNLIVFLILGVALPKEQRETLVVVVGALFSLPFILFSMAGGFLGDRFSKRSVTIGTKVMEFGVMVVAFAGLAFGSLPLQITSVFLLSAQSALFGPSKYALLPEILPQERLSWGNGILELGTFLAIIIGTMAAGFLAEIFQGRQWLSGLIFIGLASIGLLASSGITRVPAADVSRRFRANPVADLLAEWKYVRADRVLYLALLGNTYFWFLAALLQTNILFYGSDVLRLTSQKNSYLQAGVAIGIGVGSLAAGYVSGRKIEYGLIPLGALGITGFGLALGRNGIGFGQVAALLCLLGFFAGFFIVPINALLQHRPPHDRKGGVIAAANLISFGGIFLATGSYYLLTTVLHLSPRTIFLVAAGITLAATAYVTWLLPDSLVRFLLWVATNTIYRVRVHGRENVPAKGGALFVSNHLSFIDAMFLIASTDRFIRFLIFKDIFERPYIKPFARLIHAIPISSKQRPREMIWALREARETIRSGGIVCIFAEGQITRIGHLLPFRRGMERIMEGVEAPIIPVNLDGVWGSIFSFERQRFFWKLPRNKHRVTVTFGQAMPATATAIDVRQKVQELESKAFAYRKSRMPPLQRTILHTARAHWFRFAMTDMRVPPLAFGSTLVRAILLGRRLRRIWQNHEMIGILLPPSVPGALVNIAAMLAGKIPVNLNYTASEEILRSCAGQCSMEFIITSKAFLERVRITVPVRTVFLEDLLEPKPGQAEQLTALVLAALYPLSALCRELGGCQATIDDVATIVFSSGSTGEPKGVMLTHYNLASNIEQIGQTFALNSRDRFLGVLPFFHSFGFTATLLLPSVNGIGVVYHANPFDATVIGGLASRYAATFLMATPTFLQTYLHRCSPDDFGSLKYVIAGAEKLPERIAQAFEDHFGVRPLEGYGCTECSPAVAINGRDFRAPGVRQVGAKRGTIGHPMPGMSVRIVDPDTMAPLPLGEAGLLLVRGPNVMKGYLNKPEKTAEVFHDGWYTTGDIASVDEDGFIGITDRLSRFSKIAGEMVPHVKVEDKLHELIGAMDQTFVVTGVPDEKRGEKLVILHRLDNVALETCIRKLETVGLPKIWVPSPSQFFHVNEFPRLGTGKLDLRKIREIALGFEASEPRCGVSV
jgi:acyl-[acyl-carrier-protein]-phospholipid O-acyltransferase / long-chain-fatty-acid--[acyl-carrier-protein] ligase